MLAETEDLIMEYSMWKKTDNRFVIQDRKDKTDTAGWWSIWS